MSRNASNPTPLRVARKPWWLGCALLGAAGLGTAAVGCAHVSPLRTASQAPAPIQSTAASGPASAATRSFAAAASVAAAPALGAPLPEVVPVSHVEPASHAHIAGSRGAACCPPASGMPAAMAPAVGEGMMGEGGPVPPYWSVQEYLYDGGDREPLVRVEEDWTVHGLDSQDTVAHYETVDGKLCITPTNRVPIYAPRFGAVRKLTAPIISARAVGAERVLEPTGPAIQRTRDLAGNVTLPTGPRRETAVKLIDGLYDRTRGV
ncbi:MAG: hypothetical protein ACTHK7_02970, partial [Aureliella sp.]